MSRMGNKPIDIPSGVKLEQNGQAVVVSGPKGKLDITLPQGISLEQQDAKLHVKRSNDSKQQKMLHGTARSLLNAMVTGVSTGFKIDMELAGVGYRAAVAGQKLTFNLGYSNPVEYVVPEGVTATMADPTHLSLTSINKQLVGQVAANIRSFRVPDSYHGKGVKYAGEQLTLKEGKKA